MDNENGLQQLTVRLPLNVKEKIESLAKSGGCSTAEIIRCAVDGNLNKYLGGVQYVDKEQGEVIKKQLENLFTEISGMRMELHRIGVNQNQIAKQKNLENKFAEGKISIRELINARDSIVDECKGFSPAAINEIMDRFDSIAEEFVSVMAYTRISHIRNGRAAIQYARGNGRGHNGHAKRNLLIGGVGMLPDEIIPFEEQMALDWARASGKNKNQIRRIVASYSIKELDPDNIDCAYTALEVAQEFVEEAYPNRKAAIFIQNDGKGGKLHVHILVSNVDSMEHKGCTDEQTKFEYVKQNFNRVAGRHITLDNGKKAKDKFSQTERALEEENEEAVESGGAAVYIWKDDLRERIRVAMNNATSEDDFLEALEDEGVKARYGISKRYGKYISYELVDVPAHMEGANRKCKARSYTLGDAYGVEALRDKLREKAGERLRTAEQAPVNQPPVKRPVDVQTVKSKIDSVIRNVQQDFSAETPIPTPAQPTNTATTPPTAAKGTDTTPTQEQPTQGQTAPQKGELSGMALLKMKLKKMDDEEAQRQLENQNNGMDWFPRR